MIKKLQKKYALSEQGAKDLIKGCLACVLQNLSFMFPVGLLYYLISDLMNGGVPGGKSTSQGAGLPQPKRGRLLIEHDGPGF